MDETEEVKPAMASTPGNVSKPAWQLRFKAWRRRFYEHLPYISRKRYREVRSELVVLRGAIHKVLVRVGDALAHQAKITELIPVRHAAADELCLFVSFASDPKLKPHVIDHVLALREKNIAVTLVINTELPADLFEIPNELMESLNGCFIRENLGFDFGAWAHGFSLLRPEIYGKRLYLVNDSIVGPLNRAAFNNTIAGVRSSTADLIGLTENYKPCLHLQSFFLVFNERLLRSKELATFMGGVLNLPNKEAVIECYETQLTPFLRRAGYRCEVLFPNTAAAIGFGNEPTRNWKSLIERGFPFIKASVLRRQHGDADLARLVPSGYLEEAGWQPKC